MCQKIITIKSWGKDFRKTLINVIDSLTVRCFLLWHFERVRLMVSKWISVMECDKLLAPGSASRSTSRSLAKNNGEDEDGSNGGNAWWWLTASSASFSECVEIPPVLFRFVRLCIRSVARKDSCSSLSKLVRLTLLLTVIYSEIRKKAASNWVKVVLPLVWVFRTVGEIFDRGPRLASVVAERVRHNILSGQPDCVWDAEIW